MIGYFVRHPTAANLLMCVIVLLGVLGAWSLRREVFPKFDPNFIHVKVVYRGASAEEVEETICLRIEEEIEGIEGIEKVESTAREGFALVAIEVADGYAVREVLEDVQNAVDQIDNFPENAEEPIIWEVARLSAVCTVSVWADPVVREESLLEQGDARQEHRKAIEARMSDKDLLAFADQIQDELLALDEVSLVETSGFSEHRIRVEVRRRDLLAQGLTIGDVARQIRAQSLDLPVGSVETDEREIKIRVVDQRRWAEEFRDLPIKVGPTGARVPLRALATVTDTFEDQWRQTTFYSLDDRSDEQESATGNRRLDRAIQGRRCVNLDVRHTDKEDTIRVAEAVEAFIDRRQEELPPGVHLTMWGDYSFYVKDRLGMLIKNGIYGFILVFFTLWLMLNLRLSFWVAVGIPVSFLGTAFVMSLFDISLNMITMFSLIMALGIIVDDAIVIGENIFTHYSRGKDPTRAAIDGTKEVALGVIASMVTTVAVFMPLLQMEGEIGKIMRWMPVGVITALSVSLLEAFVILPNHLRHALGKIPKQAVGLRAAIDALVRRFTEHVYGPVLRWSVLRPLVPLAAMIAAFLISLGLLQSGRLKFQLFPKLDGDFLFAQVELQQGADLKRTEALVRKIEGALFEVNEHFRPRQPEGRNLIEHVSTSFGFARTMANTPQNLDSGSHLAQVIVELLDADTRDARCDEVLRVWREKVGPVADVVRLTFEQMQITPGGKPIDIQLRGEKLEDLKAASRRLREKIAAYPGIRNLSDDLRPGKEEVHVRLKPAGRPLGVTTAALASQLRGAFWGDIAEEFQRGPDAFEVHVRFTASDRRSLADLEDFDVRTPSGETRPFGEVAWYEKVRGFSQIIRVDRQRTVSVTADLDTSRGNAAEVLDDLETNDFPKLLREHPGVSINQEGQRKESTKTNTSLVRGFVIGLVMIFLLLSFVFKSYVEPLIVMMAIPFGLIGAVVGHLVHGLDWTMPSSIGFVSLAGIVVNDSIVLVAFIKLRLKEGKGLVEAVQMAGLQRFRPVVLTSATTVAGLLPMLTETSLQAQFLVPMAVSISWGLLFATVLVLILVPCLYAILARLGWSQQIEVTHQEVGETA